MALPANKTVPRGKMTIQEYLEFDRNSEERHEYVDGYIVDMAGASYEHSLIAPNLIISLGAKLLGSPCRIHSSDLRVRVTGYARYRFPDFTVICGEPHFDPDDQLPLSILNPRVIVEVVSPSSEARDRGEKFSDYRRIPTLEEYVVVAQDRPSIDVFSPGPEGLWTLRDVNGLDAELMLRSLKVSIPLHEIYAGVKFPERGDAL